MVEGVETIWFLVRRPDDDAVAGQPLNPFAENSGTKDEGQAE